MRAQQKNQKGSGGTGNGKEQEKDQSGETIIDTETMLKTMVMPKYNDKGTGKGNKMDAKSHQTQD
jgi:hypothetical protein